MKNVLIIVLVVMAALLAVVTIVGLLYLGPIVKVGIERVGPQIIKVPVTLDGVNVSLFCGSASIKNLMVGNPSGYKSPQAIAVGNVAVSLDPMSVTSTKILIHSVRVDAPVVTFEQGFGMNNLSRILSNLNSTPNNAPGQSTDASGGTAKPAPKIEIDDFLITGAKVNVVISGVVSKTVPLPDIHLTNLGKDSNGLTPAELARPILTSLITSTIQAATASVTDVGQAVKSITSSLGSLFGK